MMNVGDLVRLIPAADENTPAWRANRKAGLVVESFVLAGNLWHLVRFGDICERVFHKDLELINASR